MEKVFVFARVEERCQMIDETQRVLEACCSLHAQCQTVQRAPQSRDSEDDKEDSTSGSPGAVEEQQEPSDEQDRFSLQVSHRVQK